MSETVTNETRVAGPPTSTTTAEYLTIKTKWTINIMNPIDDDWHYSERFGPKDCSWKLCLRNKRGDREKYYSLFLMPVYDSEDAPERVTDFEVTMRDSTGSSTEKSLRHTYKAGDKGGFGHGWSWWVGKSKVRNPDTLVFDVKVTARYTENCSIVKVIGFSGWAVKAMLSYLYTGDLASQHRPKGFDRRLELLSLADAYQLVNLFDQAALLIMEEDMLIDRAVKVLCLLIKYQHTSSRLKDACCAHIKEQGNISCFRRNTNIYTHVIMHNGCATLLTV